MIKIYEVPASVWNKVIALSQKVLDNCRVIASGYGQDYEQALRELIIEINDDQVDTENCYLYIDETID